MLYSLKQVLDEAEPLLQLRSVPQQLTRQQTHTLVFLIHTVRLAGTETDGESEHCGHPDPPHRVTTYIHRLKRNSHSEGQREGGTGGEEKGGREEGRTDGRTEGGRGREGEGGREGGREGGGKDGRMDGGTDGRTESELYGEQ